MSAAWDAMIKDRMGADTLSEYAKGKLRDTPPPLKCNCGSESFEVWHEFWGNLEARCVQCGTHFTIGHEHNACKKDRV